jgi:hypothetical protein
MATLRVSGACAEPLAQISFSVEDVINAPTRLESDGIYAYWTSKEYQSVSEYVSSTPATIVNQEAGVLDPA